MTQQFGSASEQLVMQHLLAQNFKILAQNYKKFFGEIDIIAQKGDVIAFVEVKARKDSKVSLHSLITYAKQKKIIKTAKNFISQLDHPSKQNTTFRFDVALLHFQEGKQLELTYIANAFGAR
jgi:putative endonuclease